jgi:CheY-like chemotaxis protein
VLLLRVVSFPTDQPPAKGVSRLHGEGAGSRLSLSAVREQHIIKSEERELSGIEPSRLPHSVLLLEDNVIILMDTEEIVQELGVKEVWTATSTAEALAVLATAEPASALLDVDLGYENCFVVAEKLRERDIPFAFVSGYGDSLKLPPAFAAVPRLLKPHSDAGIRDVLAKLHRLGAKGD